MVLDEKALLPLQFSGRYWYGSLVNLDEVYDFFSQLGLCGPAEGGGGKSKNASGINPHQSTMNRLMQYGQASRATKTGGSYGEGAVGCSVSVGCTGNIHPSVYIPMERGIPDSIWSPRRNASYR